MRPRDQAAATRIDKALRRFAKDTRPLPGIRGLAERRTFLEQLFESIHRVQYIQRGVLERPLDPRRVDPKSDLFDPIKGAAIRAKQGNHDEASWLVFLSVHFGKHGRYGWQLSRDVYGNLGGKQLWDWARTSANPEAFRRWLRDKQAKLRENGSGRLFGNHRKYQSLNADKPNGTGSAFVTYVNWVKPQRTHAGLVREATTIAGEDPKELFAHLYDSLDTVASFGRTAKFDYLTMLGKLRLAEIVPGRPYLQGSTGPLRGAKLMFLGSPKAADATNSELDAWVVELGSALQVGMQEMEDSLCNWQKCPADLRRFRG